MWGMIEAQRAIRQRLPELTEPGPQPPVMAQMFRARGSRDLSWENCGLSGSGGFVGATYGCALLVYLEGSSQFLRAKVWTYLATARISASVSSGVEPSTLPQGGIAAFRPKAVPPLWMICSTCSSERFPG